MDADDLSYFKSKLESLRDDIKATLATEDASDSSIAPDDAIGRLTRMEAIQAQRVSQAGRHRLKKRLGQVQHSLEQIEAGSFGRCTRCDTEIPRGRLEIMPESSLCVACAAR